MLLKGRCWSVAVFHAALDGQAPRDRLYRRSLLAAAALLLALSVLIRPINHDESQYVAAIQLMRTGWPYLDFAYLQPPLQPLLFAPLALVHAGWMLVAVRLVNAFLEWRKIMGVSRVFVRAYADNVGAIELYERFGFRPYILGLAMAIEEEAANQQ